MGTAKAWLPFGEETLLQRVVRRVDEAVSPVAVVAAREQELPPLPREIIVARDARSSHGPLEGMLAGLLALRGKVDAAFVSSCDAPLLRPDFVRRMVELLGDRPAVAPRIDGHWHPLTGVYRLELIPRIEQMLLSDRLRVRDVLDECGALAVGREEFAAVDPNLDSLRSCNTPEEYEKVRSNL